jgi:four helix bundle protein
MQNFKTLKVWTEAHELVLYVYTITRTFPKTERFNLTSQLRRAATSIPANIAEGCGKFTQSDLANFLQTALGSSNETEYLTLLSHDLGYVADESFQDVQTRVNQVKAKLINLIKQVRKKP